LDNDGDLFVSARSIVQNYNNCPFYFLQVEAKIIKGPRDDLESYLAAVDQLRNNVEFFSSNKSFKSSDGVLTNANNLLATAMLKLEEEFKQLLSTYRSVFLPDFQCFFISSKCVT
jgi:exocyst complex protein 7